jgi:hypothetical protein
VWAEQARQIAQSPPLYMHLATKRYLIRVQPIPINSALTRTSESEMKKKIGPVWLVKRWLQSSPADGGRSYAVDPWGRKWRH